MRSESPIAPLVEDPVKQEDSAGAVECTREKGENESRVLWEGIGKLEGGDKYTGPSQG